MLGLFILGIGIQIVSMVFAFIPVLGWIISIVAMLASLGLVGLWVYSLISAINGKKEPTPFIGGMFQKWFASM